MARELLLDGLFIEKLVGVLVWGLCRLERP